MTLVLFKQYLILLLCLTIFEGNSIYGHGEKLKNNQVLSAQGGGVKTKLKRFPFMVKIYVTVVNPESARIRSNINICSGVLLNPSMVLTVAHCVLLGDFKLGTHIEVVVGNRAIKESKKTHLVSVVGPHNDYNPKTRLHNIAIIKTMGKFKYGPLVKPALLTESNEWMKDEHVRITAVGWAYPKNETYGPVIGTNDMKPLELYKVYLSNADRGVCADSIDDKFKGSGVFCLKPVPGRVVCRDDYGGPVLVDGKVVGLVSHDPSCGLFKPSLFTDVYHYRKWIKKAIETLDKKNKST